MERKKPDPYFPLVQRRKFNYLEDLTEKRAYTWYNQKDSLSRKWTFQQTFISHYSLKTRLEMRNAHDQLTKVTDFCILPQANALCTGFNNGGWTLAFDFGTEEERLIKFHEPSIVSSVNGNVKNEPFIITTTLGMANEPGAIHFYQPSTHQLLKWKCPFSNHASLWSSAFHSSLQLVAGGTGLLVLIEHLDRLTIRKLPNKSDVLTLDYHANELYAGCRNGMLWNCDFRKPKCHSITNFSNAITCLKVSNYYCYSSCMNGAIFGMDLRYPKIPLIELKGHFNEYSHLKFDLCHNDTTLIAGGQDGRLMGWDLRSAQCIMAKKGQHQEARIKVQCIESNENQLWSCQGYFLESWSR